MAQNISQIYTANPITLLGANDLIYVGVSPYGAADDAAIKASDLINTSNLQFTAGKINTIQNISTADSPTFTGLTISGASIDINTNTLTLSGNSTIDQDLDTTATPTFVSVALSTTAMTLSGNTLTVTGNSSLNQDLLTNSTVQFANIGIGGIALFPLDIAGGTITAPGAAHYNIDNSLTVAPSGATTSAFATYNANMGLDTTTAAFNGGTANIPLVNVIRGSMTDAGGNNTAQMNAIYGECIHSSAGTATTCTGITANSQVAGSAPVTDLYGIYCIGNSTSAGWPTNMTGIYARATHDASTTCTNNRAVYGEASSINNNTITNNSAGYFTTIASNAFTIIGNNHGVYIADVVNSGTVTLNYGLYIENIDSGTTNYAIYSVGGQSYFAGNVGFGAATTPNQAVHSMTTTDVQLKVERSASANDATIQFTNSAGSMYAGVNGSLYWAVGTSSDLNTNGVLYVTSGAKVGIGTEAPAVICHIFDTSEQLRLGYDGSNYMTFTINSSGDLSVGNGSNPVMDIQTAGEITFPLQCAFAAYLSATSTNHSGTGGFSNCVPDTETYDQNADYDTTTGVFTAPVTGRYELCAQISMTDWTAAGSLMRLRITTSNRTYETNFVRPSSTTDDAITVTVYADMDAADTAQISGAALGEATDIIDWLGGASPLYTWFSGKLVA